MLIRIEKITKFYEMGSEVVHALSGVSLSIEKNEYVGPLDFVKIA